MILDTRYWIIDLLTIDKLLVTWWLGDVVTFMFLR